MKLFGETLIKLMISFLLVTTNSQPLEKQISTPEDDSNSKELSNPNTKAKSTSHRIERYGPLKSGPNNNNNQIRRYRYRNSYRKRGQSKAHHDRRQYNYDGRKGIKALRNRFEEKLEIVRLMFEDEINRLKDELVQKNNIIQNQIYSLESRFAMGSQVFSRAYQGSDPGDAYSDALAESNVNNINLNMNSQFEPAYDDRVIFDNEGNLMTQDELFRRIREFDAKVKMEQNSENKNENQLELNLDNENQRRKVEIVARDLDRIKALRRSESSRRHERLRQSRSPRSIGIDIDYEDYDINLDLYEDEDSEEY